MNVHRFQNRYAEAVLFQQMTELVYRRLVRHRLVAQIDLRELPHQRRVVQRLFHRRIGKGRTTVAESKSASCVRCPLVGVRRRTRDSAAQPARTTRSREPLDPSLPEKPRAASSFRSLKASCHRQCPLYHESRASPPKLQQRHCVKQKTCTGSPTAGQLRPGAVSIHVPAGRFQTRIPARDGQRQSFLPACCAERSLRRQCRCARQFG